MSESGYLGYALIVAACFILALPSRSISRGIKKLLHDHQVFGIMLMVTMLLATANVISKHLINHGMSWLEVFFLTNIMTGTLCLSTILKRSIRTEFMKIYRYDPKTLGLISINSIVEAIGEAATMLVFSMMPLLAYQAINSTQSFFTMFWAQAAHWLSPNYFHEHLDRRSVLKKLRWFAVISLGIILVATGV